MKRSNELINKFAGKSLSALDMQALRGGDGDEFPIPPKDGSPTALRYDGTTDKDKKDKKDKNG